MTSQVIFSLTRLREKSSLSIRLLYKPWYTPGGPPAMRTFRSATKLITVAVVAIVAAVFAAGAPAFATAKAKNSGPVTLRLGYFPNVTHASAIVGVEGGIFAKKLGPNVDLQLKTFNSGTEAVQALQADAI